jgi:hypothetical protein
MAKLIKTVRVRGNLEPKVPGGADGKLLIFRDRRDLILRMELASFEGSFYPGFVRIRYANTPLSEINAVIAKYLAGPQNFQVIQDPFDPNVIPFQEITPEPPIPAPTPQEIKQQRASQIAQKEDTNIKEEASTLDPESISNSVTEDSKPKGLQKVGQLLINLAKSTATAFVPVALNLIKQLGADQFEIELAKLKEEHPEWNEQELQAEVKKLLCPTKEQLDLIIRQRDGLVEKLNATGTKLDGLSVTINFGANFAEVLATLIKILKGASFYLNQALKIPGASALPYYAPAQSLATDLNTAADTITFKPDGTPNIPPLVISAAQVSPAVALVQSTIVKCVDLLDQIDTLILLCDPNATLNPLSNSIDDIYANESLAEVSDNGNTYKGFILEVETRPYTPRVNESRAVGKNNSGITMIYTDWSFASDTQVLINELKSIIDRDNLKAY